MLTSVPPLPANYKQRAGRSGRNNKVKSVCITLCGSDAIGLRTLLNPVETIIKRPVDVPTVDLDSQQVVMRHVNSYLIRQFGVFANGNNGGSLNQMVLDYYTPFTPVWDKNLRCYIYYDESKQEIDVNSGMGDPAGTNYQIFSDKCSQSMSKEMKEDMRIACEISAKGKQTAAPLDWMENQTPEVYLINGEVKTYDYYAEEGTHQFIPPTDQQY